MFSFRYRGRFRKGVCLVFKVLLNYKLLSIRNLFSSPEKRRERLKGLHARNAAVLRQRMTELRGIFIKIGQFLSSRVDILPEEYTDELSKLQDQVPPAPLTDILRRIKQELGNPADVFSSFDESPIASASLGQVHRAGLKDGQEVVIKVQYPGIEEVIAADIRTLDFVIKILKRLYRRINLSVIYSEFSRVVQEELDYILEGRNAEAFARNFAHNKKIRIPRVYWPFTTSKVLTLEYLEGIKITDFDEIAARGIDKRETIRILAEAYSQMFFVDGLFHADPHPGNIFVQPGPVVILVDFGMVDRISAPMREGLRRAFTAVVDRNSLGVVRSLVDMGFIPLTKDIRPLVQFVDRLMEKYRDMRPKEFKSMAIEEIGRDIQEAIKISPTIQIPNDFILFGRVVGMLNGLSSRLDPEANIIEIAAPFAKRFIREERPSSARALRLAGSGFKSLLRLPGLLSELLVTTSRGETRVEIASEDITGELRRMARLGRGLILAILAIGLAGIAALLWAAGLGDQAKWPAIPAAILLFWLVIDLSRFK